MSNPVHELQKLASVLGNGGMRKLRVLVVEGNAMHQKLMVRMLERQGHEAEVAADGLQALRLSGQKNFDLILMDARIPEIDALETTRRIRRREQESGGRVPILISGAMPGDREKCLEAGADGYLPKPVSPEKLLAALEEVTAPGSSQ
ncbi:MAG: response regulator [Acidobacteria bacterium]|nr:response regulator [Acidobacteriota bacterium]